MFSLHARQEAFSNGVSKPVRLFTTFCGTFTWKGDKFIVTAWHTMASRSINFSVKVKITQKSERPKEEPRMLRRALTDGRSIWWLRSWSQRGQLCWVRFLGVAIVRCFTDLGDGPTCPMMVVDYVLQVTSLCPQHVGTKVHATFSSSILLRFFLLIFNLLYRNFIHTSLERYSGQLHK